MRRFHKDALVSIGALLIVLGALMAVDGRVREQVWNLLAGASSAQAVAGTGSELQHLGSILFTVARDQSIEHAPMVLFVVAASVLVVFMLRL